MTREERLTAATEALTDLLAEPEPDHGQLAVLLDDQLAAWWSES